MSIKVGSRQSYDMDGLLKEIAQPGLMVVLYFFSWEYERFEPHKAVKRTFPQAVCVGASMQGGWSTTGVVEKGIVALSLGADEVEEVFTGFKEGIKSDPAHCAQAAIEELKGKLGYRNISPDDYLGLIFFDGLGRGEVIMQALSMEARLNLPFVGGAASDERFAKTLVCCDERLSADGLVLVVMKMKIPFYYTHSLHLSPEGSSIVATKADAQQRLVWELNGEPAAPYYAKLIGAKSIEALTHEVFIQHPLGVVSGNTVYCRSLYGVVEGRALRFFCYIEAGTTLHLLRPGDILAESRKIVQEAQSYLPQVQGALLCNCSLRLLELKLLKKERAFNDLFTHLSFIGFNGFGEELFTHHTQTLTAIFFGRP
ncbi:MAG: FIST C-terminal domain-containing protein [Treponema sp.]|jgi:hypothetical protein|nr:FIST C-terminal domain-containing protein [Treponema sp.]